MNTSRKLLVIQVAALGDNLVQQGFPTVCGMPWHSADPVFPAVTCTAQATLRTASPPSAHGMVSNGRFFPDLAKVLFWEQSARLVDGPRIWESIRASGRRVGMMFWQQSLGEAVDLILSPRPIHKHGGGMMQDCYSKPGGLYSELKRKTGSAFNLFHYWGPFASRTSSDWIVKALTTVMGNASAAPDLLFAYIPHLDYGLQKKGPLHKETKRNLDVVHGQLNRVISTARNLDYDVLLYGDYAIGPVTRGPVYPNRFLREQGWFQCQMVKGMAYPDFFGGDAFAMVDHEIAHVYVPDASLRPAVREGLQSLGGVGHILQGETLHDAKIDHPNTGDLLLISEPGSWFAYPWWTDPGETPDFAAHIDIHNKPGFDPCEMFLGWPPLSVSQNASKVRGTHGRIGPDRRIAWATTCAFEKNPESLITISSAVKEWLRQT